MPTISVLAAQHIGGRLKIDILAAAKRAIRRLRGSIPSDGVFLIV